MPSNPLKGRPRIEVRVDPEVRTAVEKRVYSTLQDRIPFGAISDWCEAAIAYRLRAIEIAVDGGVIWTDTAGLAFLRKHIPALANTPTPGTDPSEAF